LTIVWKAAAKQAGFCSRPPSIQLLLRRNTLTLSFNSTQTSALTHRWKSVLVPYEWGLAMRNLMSPQLAADVLDDHSTPPRPPKQPHVSLSRKMTSRRKTYEIDYNRMHFIPLFCMRDTPLRSLYRLYEYTCTRSHNEIMEEGMYFFQRQKHWRVKDIPDPGDTPFAMLFSPVWWKHWRKPLISGLNWGSVEGSLMKNLHSSSFSKRIKSPVRDSPAWCAAVQPLEETLDLAPNLHKSPHMGFRQRNIIADANQL
jgi:hypothetical protein